MQTYYRECNNKNAKRDVKMYGWQIMTKVSIITYPIPIILLATGCKKIMDVL